MDIKKAGNLLCCQFHNLRPSHCLKDKTDNTEVHTEYVYTAQITHHMHMRTNAYSYNV